MSSIWTLRRSTTGAVIAGVCSALATRYRIDPLIVRIVAIVLLLSGIGLVPYLALWLLTPRGNEPVAPLPRMIPSTKRVSPRVWSAIVIVLTAATLLSSGLSSAIVPAVVIGFLWYTGALRPKAAKARATTPGEDFQRAAAAWQARLDSRMSPGFQRPRTGPEAPGAWTPPQRTTVPRPQRSPGPQRAPAHQPQQWWAPVQAPTFRPSGRPVAPVTVQSYFAHPQPAPTHVEPSPSATASLRQARGRRRVTVVTVAMSTLAVGMTGLASTLAPMSPPGYLGGGLVGVGAGLVASAWWGRPRWLMPLAIGLAAFALIAMAVMV